MSRDSDKGKGLMSWLGFAGSKKAAADQLDIPLYTLPSPDVSVDYKTLLGRGSFGLAYKGKYKGKPCAVKLLNAGVGVEVAEVGLLIQHHENVAQVYGFWYGDNEEDKGRVQPTIVMELCSSSLKSYLDGQKKPNNRLTLDSKLTILHQITSAMIYLHSQNIVHGDLSAANVLLQIDGPQASQVLTVKVADFGQARFLKAESLKQLSKTHSRDDVMPPEVLQGKITKLTTQVDVFSFGCLIPYVAYCVYPKPAQHGSEFEKRKHYLNDVSETQQRIFLPLMEKCLAGEPYLRETFETIAGMLAPHMKKYIKGKHSETEEEKVREIEVLKSKLLEHARNIEKLEVKNTAAEATSARLKQENKTLESKLFLNSCDYKKLKAEKEELEVITMNLKEESMTDIHKSKQVEAERDKAKQVCAALEMQVHSLKKELSKTQRDLGASRSTSYSQEKGLERLKEELKDKRRIVDDLEWSIQTYKRKLEVEEKKAKASQKENTNLEEKRDELCRKVEQLNYELNIVKDESAMKEREHSDLKAQYDKTQEEVNVLLQESEKEIDDLKETLKKREEGYSKTLTELTKEREKVVALQNEVHGLEKDITAKYKHLSVQEQRLCKEEEHKQEILSELNKLQNQYQVMHRKLTSTRAVKDLQLAEEREKHKEEVAQYKDGYRKLEAQLRVVEASRGEMVKLQDLKLAKERERHDLKVAQYKDESRKLEAQLRVVEASRGEMMKLQDLQLAEEREKHKEEVAQYKDECRKFEAQLRVVEASRREEIWKLQKLRTRQITTLEDALDGEHSKLQDCQEKYRMSEEQWKSKLAEKIKLIEFLATELGLGKEKVQDLQSQLKAREVVHNVLLKCVENECKLKFKDFQTQLTDSKNQCTTYREMVSHKDHDLQDVHEELIAVRSSYEQIKTQCDQYENQCASLHEMVNHKDFELQDLHEDLIAARSSCEKIRAERDQYEDAQLDQQEKLRELEQCNRKLEETVCRDESHLTFVHDKGRLEAQLTILEDAHRKVLAEKHQLQISHDCLAIALEQQIHGLEFERIRHFRDRIEKLRQSEAELKAGFQALEVEKAKFQEQRRLYKAIKKNENVSLMSKLAVSAHEVKQQTRQLKDAVQTVQFMKVEENLLINRVREKINKHLVPMVKEQREQVEHLQKKLDEKEEVLVSLLYL